MSQASFSKLGKGTLTGSFERCRQFFLVERINLDSGAKLGHARCPKVLISKAVKEKGTTIRPLSEEGVYAQLDLTMGE